MWTPLQRAPLVALVSLMLMASASADGGGIKQPSLGGPIFDITHFDVIPFDNFQQTAYTALFAYRDASRHDQGLESFRVVNWVLAPNHSQIIDVWDSLDAFNRHLAQDHSVDFRFAVQVQPPPPPPGFNCCIGSPIDDRQYSLVKSFGTPWTNKSLPSDGRLQRCALCRDLCRFSGGSAGYRPRQRSGGTRPIRCRD
jgi:hypothetical protein